MADESKKIAEDAIDRIKRKITDLVFLEIQNDRELMLRYLRCVEANTLNVTNQQIGKAVKSAFNLENLDEREDNPTCTLIGSHQKF